MAEKDQVVMVVMMMMAVVVLVVVVVVVMVVAVVMMMVMPMDKLICVKEEYLKLANKYSIEEKYW